MVLNLWYTAGPVGSLQQLGVFLPSVLLNCPEVGKLSP